MGTILIVDDDMSVRGYLSALLEHLGAKVLAADGLDSALEKMSNPSIKIDGVIADMIINGGNGIDVAKAATERGIKTIFSSSITDEYNVNLMLEHGWLIPKPVRMAGAKRIIDHFRGLA